MTYDYDEIINGSTTKKTDAAVQNTVMNPGNTAPIYRPNMKPSGNTNLSNNNEPKNNVTPSNGFDSSTGYPVRDLLVKNGFDNEKIGWDGEMVTYDGIPMIHPDANVDGRTFTNPESYTAQMNDFYKKTGSDDELVGVTKYTAGQLGLSGALTYNEDGSMVMLGGERINGVVNMNGKAYAPRSEINKAVEQFKNSAGLKTNEEMVKAAMADTADKSRRYESLADEYANGEFEYNPADDNVFQAVSDEYRKLAQMAYDDTYAQQAARTGGYGNSMATTSSALAYQKMLDSLAMQLPEYADRAENRYESRYDKIQDAASRYGSTLDRNLMLYEAQAKDNLDIKEALKADEQRDETNRAALDSEAYQEREYVDNKENTAYERAINDKIYNEITLPESRAQRAAMMFDVFGSISQDNPALARLVLSDATAFGELMRNVFGYSIPIDEIVAVQKKVVEKAKKEDKTQDKSVVLYTPSKTVYDHNDFFKQNTNGAVTDTTEKKNSSGSGNKSLAKMVEEYD